jgi:hypothetical protein
MKHIFYIIICCLLSNTTLAQNTAKAIKFINEVVSDENISYQDSVDWGMRAFMHRALSTTRVLFKFRDDSVDYEYKNGAKKRMSKSEATSLLIKQMPVIKDRMNLIIADSLVLSDAEITYANDQIANMRNYKWKSNLLPHSKLLLADSLSALQRRWSDLRRKPLADLSKKEREKWMNKLFEKSDKEFTAFHKFSAPIFLRNDTYCLFYYGNDCINTINWGCNSGNFMVYKKQNGKWKQWGYISHWQT